MRIALIAPYSIGTMRGNITTVRRINRFLNRAGIGTLVLAPDALPPEEMTRRLLPFSPTLIHGFHARSCGEIAAILAERFRIPFIITITGSDLYDPAQRDHPATARSLTRAAAITCFSRQEVAEVAARFPGVAGRITVVSQGVEALPEGGSPGFGIPDDAFVILLPAALRPVKNVEFAIAAVKPLWQGDNRFLLVIAGGELDRAYAGDIRALLAAAPWARWLGEVPYEQMGDLYRRADLVLNCSHFEGMSNSLMEAMALGRPVVAMDIPGNRTLIRQGDTGWLFHGAAAFGKLAARLAGNETLRREVGGRARQSIENNFSPVTEAQQYRELYLRLT